jgi:radical SAM superfamily enzyme YgiQ (UPF0313 family)
VELYLLHLRIELLKKRLVRLAEDRGRTDPLVIALSRRIDQLMVEYMRKMRKAG